MPCLLLENFQNCIVGRCGCQAVAKSYSSLQKSIENTTTETNFKYLRLQTLITLSSIESCGSPPRPFFSPGLMFPGQKTENEHSGYNNGQKGYDPFGHQGHRGLWLPAQTQKC